MPSHASSIFMFLPGYLLLAAVREVVGVTYGLPQDRGFCDTRVFLELNFLEADKLAFSILVSATHSLFRVPCTVAKPAQLAFGQGHCGLPLQRTACASSCPCLADLQGNEATTTSPQMSAFVVVQFVAAQLPDVPMQRRESRPPSIPAASTVALG